MFFFRKETTIFDVEFHLVNLFKIKWLFKVRFYFIYKSGNRHVCSILPRMFKKTNCFWKLRWTYILWYKSQLSIQTFFSPRKSKKPKGHYRKRLTCYQTNFRCAIDPPGANNFQYEHTVQIFKSFRKTEYLMFARKNVFHSLFCMTDL